MISEETVVPHDPFTIREQRIFVLDTNVLLHDSNALFSFMGVVVVVPFGVLEELDKFKSEGGQLGRNARQTIRSLDELRIKGSLQDGVVYESSVGKTFVKVMHSPVEGEHICADSVDNQIIALVQKLGTQGMKVTLVTKDINARVKADALKLLTEDYVGESVDIESFYKGWVRLCRVSKQSKICFCANSCATYWRSALIIEPVCYC